MQGKVLGGLALLGMLAGCGTTYVVPEVSEGVAVEAQQMFAEEQATGGTAGRRLSGGLALAQYRRVVARVEPVAEAFCEREMAAQDVDCDVQIQIDTEMAQRNAYQTYIDGRPVIAFTVPMIEDARNEDELAFVLGHEVGHHIGQHAKKKQQQAMAGALVMMTLTGIMQAQATASNPYRYSGNDQQTLQDAAGLGGIVGGSAYSQTYELESDVIGTHIAAEAGYDPVRGARFFARGEEAKTEDGKLSFWGTHPPDEKRLATVMVTARNIAAEQQLERVAR